MYITTVKIVMHCTTATITTVRTYSYWMCLTWTFSNQRINEFDSRQLIIQTMSICNRITNKQATIDVFLSLQFLKVADQPIFKASLLSYDQAS